MKKENVINVLDSVLCAECLACGPGIMMIGVCEECHGPTGWGDLKLCAKCATASGRCGRCKKPLDKQG